MAGWKLYYKLLILRSSGPIKRFPSQAYNMSNDSNTSTHEKWKKLTRFLIHILHIIIALMLFVAALLNVIAGPTALGVRALIFYGLISIFLVIFEMIYFRRLDKPYTTPKFTKQYLSLLASVVGRGVLYQILGLPYMLGINYSRYRRGNVGTASDIFGVVIWSIGFCLMMVAILAKAYNFADWIEDESHEGELRLESDDGDIGFLRGQGGLSKL